MAALGTQDFQKLMRQYRRGDLVKVDRATFPGISGNVPHVTAERSRAVLCHMVERAPRKALGSGTACQPEEAGNSV